MQRAAMVNEELSPYIKFSRSEWRKFRQNTPMTLADSDLDSIQGIAEPISLLEIEEVYLPLSRLLNLYVAATQELYKISTQFLGHPQPNVPYVIGIAGSVGVGKSTTSRVLQSLLSRWPNHPHVDLVTTDGFIYPNAILERNDLMQRKGFPESYDLHRLINFLIDLKSGCRELRVPVYSHYTYDIQPQERQIIRQPDILILEGLNILQVGWLANTGKKPRFISDFLDFTIYVHAETAIIKRWFLKRFMFFREQARLEPAAFFYRFAQLTNAAAINFAIDVWTNINEANLYKNILPHKDRAKLILTKTIDHSVQEILLKKI